MKLSRIIFSCKNLIFIQINDNNKKIIDKVRKDIVNKALLNLPKEENFDILKMCLEMSPFKSTYSFNAESGYLAY